MANEHNLTIERWLKVPLERVWQAWTDAAQIQKWWGPQGVTNPTCVWEARPGGKIDIVMLAGPQLGNLRGAEWPMSGKFETVIPQQKLVYSAVAIVDGQPVMETRTTLTLEAEGNQTKMTLMIEVTKITPEAAGPLAGMEAGWNQSLDKLTNYLI